MFLFGDSEALRGRAEVYSCGSTPLVSIIRSQDLLSPILDLQDYGFGCNLGPVVQVFVQMFVLSLIFVLQSGIMVCSCSILSPF